MRKILVSMFLLVFGLCLVGCIHSTYNYQFHFYVDGGNGSIGIETSSSFNPDVRLCKDVEDMCTLGCVENSYFIELNGGENGSREITFIATPDEGYQVKEWLFNGKIVEGNKTNSYTAIVTNEEDYIGVISVRFEEILSLEKGTLNVFLTTVNPDFVLLKDGSSNSEIVKSFSDFILQSFSIEFFQIELTELDGNNDYDMPQVDYYIKFNNSSTNEFVKYEFFNVVDSNDDYFYGWLKTSYLNGIYQFNIDKNLFYQIFDYFFDNTELTKLFYSLQEAFDNGFLTHNDLQQIADLNNNGSFNPIAIDEEIAILIMKDFCKMHNVAYDENPGSVRCFGEYNGYYAVMVDGCGICYLTYLTEETVDGITFNYGSSQHILIWKYNK